MTTQKSLQLLDATKKTAKRLLASICTLGLNRCKLTTTSTRISPDTKAARTLVAAIKVSAPHQLDTLVVLHHHSNRTILI